MGFVDPTSVSRFGPDVLLDDWLTDWQPGSGGPGARALVFRRELGLATDRPIVMTGHQPVFWHAGILAKYLAVDAIAERVGASAGWVVPDQDVVEPGRVRRPVLRSSRRSSRAGGAGLWEAEDLDLLRWPGDVSAIPAGARAAGMVDGGSGCGFDELIDLLRAHAGEPSAARQVWGAHTALLADRAGLNKASSAFATDLNRTSLFSSLIGLMRDGPCECVRAYNAAVRAFADAGMRELMCDERCGRVELPLWKLVAGEPRRVVYAHELDGMDRSSLVPRALLLTGLMRLAGCELFLHGTGGGVYDRVTEHWFMNWLGESLAPAGVVSATLRLDLGVPEISRDDLRTARWRAHHARHSPGMLGDAEAQAEKTALVERIGAAPPGERSELYAQMHRLLVRVRADRSDRLCEFDRAVAAIESALADADIAADRTWPWMLHDDGALGVLREEIRVRLGVRVGGEAG